MAVVGSHGVTPCIGRGETYFKQIVCMLVSPSNRGAALAHCVVGSVFAFSDKIWVRLRAMAKLRTRQRGSISITTRFKPFHHIVPAAI